MNKTFERLLKMHRVLTRGICEGLFLLRLWSPQEKSHVSAVRSFVRTNSERGWTSSRGQTKVLVEGHLAEYGPNYMFRTALAAKAVEQELGGADVTVVVDGFSYEWQTAHECYGSFGIVRWIYLGRRFILLAPFLLTISLVRAALSFAGLRTPRDVIELRHGSIKVGDLLYDQVLRSTKSPTIRTVGLAIFFNLVRSWYYYYQYQLLFRMNRFAFYIATHTAYPQYGLLCRVALARGVKVLETTDIQMSLYSKIDQNNLPTYHQGIHDSIKVSLDSDGIELERLEDKARQNLEKRFNSELDQIDAMKAYSGRVYGRQELLEQLGVSSGKKIGFVLSHVFVDSPHLSSSMLHNDYYDWLLSTIDSCAKSEDMVWVIKPHPSSALYGEQGMVEALVKGAHAQNLFICPADLNTRSLVMCADVVVTVHGTAGLEFSCLGIPVVLAGTPFYAGFGFTHEPASVKQYEEIVKAAALLEPLTSAQIKTALRVFGVWENVFDWNNPIITSEVLANVWGNGTERDLGRAFEILTRNLNEADPRQLKLWEFASMVARHE
jgi:hypothetical protein